MRHETPDETEYRREAGYANRYRDSRFREGSGPETHNREVRAIEELLALAGVTTGPFLDMPCGSGRLSGLLPEPVVQVDRHFEMVSACHGDTLGVQARGAALPFAADTFRGALCMRLLQHIPSSSERQAILAQLCRVTDGPIVLSFFHSVTLQHLRRIIRRLFGKTRSGRSAVTYARIRADLTAVGLEIAAARPLRRFVSEQWILLVQRKP